MSELGNRNKKLQVMGWSPTTTPADTGPLALSGWPSFYLQFLWTVTCSFMIRYIYLFLILRYFQLNIASVVAGGSLTPDILWVASLGHQFLDVICGLASRHFSLLFRYLIEGQLDIFGHVPGITESTQTTSDLAKTNPDGGFGITCCFFNHCNVSFLH